MTIRKPRSFEKRPKATFKTITTQALDQIKALATKQEIEQEEIIVDKSRWKYWTIGPTVTTLENSSGTRAVPIPSPQAAFTQFDSNYNLIITEWWICGVSAPAWIVAAENFGRRFKLNGVIVVPEVSQALFLDEIADVNLKADIQYFTPNNLNSWVNFLNKPLIIKAGDEFVDEFYNVTLTDVVFVELIKGMHKPVI